MAQMPVVESIYEQIITILVMEMFTPLSGLVDVSAPPFRLQWTRSAEPS